MPQRVPRPLPAYLEEQRAKPHLGPLLAGITNEDDLKVIGPDNIRMLLLLGFWRQLRRPRSAFDKSFRYLLRFIGDAALRKEAFRLWRRSTEPDDDTDIAFYRLMLPRAVLETPYLPQLRPSWYAPEGTKVLWRSHDLGQPNSHISEAWIVLSVERNTYEDKATLIATSGRKLREAGRMWLDRSITFGKNPDCCTRSDIVRPEEIDFFRKRERADRLLRIWHTNGYPNHPSDFTAFSNEVMTGVIAPYEPVADRDR